MTASTSSAASRRQFVLVWLSVAVLPLAVITATVTRLHKHHLSTLAADWSVRGDAAYAAGRAGAAVDDFLNALMYAREDRALRLKLARALVAAGRGAEARGYLLTLWEDEPGDGPVNLELGRIAARDRNVAEATRYYHAAIEGAWDRDSERRRRESRLELVDYLVSAGEGARARPELLALAADAGDEPALRRTIAALFARSGQYASAQAAYEQVLASSPNDTAALSGAGEAAFRSADYPAASRFLRRAVAHGESSPEVLRDAAVAQLIVDLDPWQRRISTTARAKRASTAFDAARTRLIACLALHPESDDIRTASGDVDRIRSQAEPRSLARHPDDVDTVMDTVFEVERVAARLCGEPGGIDRALYLLGLERKRER